MNNLPCRTYRCDAWVGEIRRHEKSWIHHGCHPLVVVSVFFAALHFVDCIFLPNGEISWVWVVLMFWDHFLILRVTPMLQQKNPQQFHHGMFRFGELLKSGPTSAFLYFISWVNNLLKYFYFCNDFIWNHRSCCRCSGAWINIKMKSCQHRKSHWGDQTVVTIVEIRLSYDRLISTIKSHILVR